MGWATACLVYEKGPLPEPGSLTEAMFLMVQTHYRQIEVAKARAIVQATADSKKAGEAWSDYTEKVFAPMHQAKAERQLELLKKVAGMGPVGVRSMVNTKKRTLPVRKKEKA